MESNLIAGYLAYTTADEFGTSAAGDAPASTITNVMTTTCATGSYTLHTGC
ncbi:LxmA leader domain family RiPP [Nocardia sp. NPDC051570]|uniref:LxmA leader domain family RiPP n=1 Tax=Nocardia sp. NPDC051570 TaxID=3364324 RepID=UPI0037AF2B04